MSWISDGIGNYEKFLGQAFGKISPYMMGGSVANEFVQNEVVNKSDLRGAQIEAFLSGLPFVGGMIRGIDNAQQLEDLYNNTGQVPSYPGNQSGGLSSAGKSIGGISRKIEKGTHDLFEHYSGTKDDTIEGLHEKGIMKYGDEL